MSINVAPLQTNLFSSGSGVVDAARRPTRHRLDELCWVDHCSRWLGGSDHLLLQLIEQLDFQSRSRAMFNRWVVEPRLTSFAELDDPALPQVFRDASAHLETMYQTPFDQLFTNFYRDGSDSVAWHADRVGQHQVDPLVAIVSLGGPRRFLLRPRNGGSSTRYLLESGDLLVMGGSTQHRWEHCVPKVATASPRISVTLRHGRGSRRAREVSAKRS